MSPKGTSPDEQSSRKLEKKLIALFVFPFIVFAAISCWEGLNDQQIAELLEIFNFSKFGAPINGALITFLLLLFGLFAFSPSIRWIQKSLSALTGKYFVISLAALAVLGAAAALYTPSYTNLFKPDTQQSTSSTQNAQGSGNQQNQSSKDPSSDLRLHLLYITGGIIAVLGLIETNRKNSQDHIREVHAARRDRYIEAVDKLSSEQAPVRLGGVYALVGLVDEWLDDDNIDEKIRTKEGQIIINNLCSYIRSPFLAVEKIEAYEAHNDFNQLQEYEAEFSLENYSPQLRALYERSKESGTFKNFQDITADYAKFHEEQDVRRAIFVEMSNRSSTFTENEKGDMIPSRGTWSEFEFNFSRAPIFYPLNHLTIEKGIFSYASFYGQADFNESTFIRDAAFNGVKFTQGANFNEVTFNGEANFSAQGDTKTTFGGDATFNGVQFTQGANFNEVTFNGGTNFSTQGDTKTTFGGKATFNGVQFTLGANFNEVTFNGEANFSTQGDTKTTFGGKAPFGGKATFNGVQFTQGANFNEVTFNGEANFSTQGNTKTTFGGDTTFNGTQFTQEANFNEVTFNEVTFNESADLSIRDDPKTVFEGEAVFNDATFNKKATFHGVRFKKVASFNSVVFYKDACFKYVTFENNSNFTIKDTGYRKTEFKESANFQSALFNGETSFKGAIFNGRANFYPNQLDIEDMKFTQKADFSYAHFMKGAHFLKVEFEGDALFGFSKFHEDKTHEILPDEDLIPYERVLIRSSMTHTAPEIYAGTANFFDTKFHGVADFMFAEFTGESIFTSAKFYRRASFENSYIYEKIAFSGKFGRINISASFSNKNNPDDYNFDSKKEDRSGNKLYIIEKDEISYGDKKFYVPKGCKLFDPEASKDLFGNYKQSEPAKPLENSDTEEKKPTA